MFGGPSSIEKEQQSRALEEEIANLQIMLERSKQNHTLFGQNMSEDYDTFRRAKHDDFKRAMAEMCQNRIRNMSKSLDAWKNIQQCYKELN